jgi:hypothetical protein
MLGDVKQQREFGARAVNYTGNVQRAVPPGQRSFDVHRLHGIVRVRKLLQKLSFGLSSAAPCFDCR